MSRLAQSVKRAVDDLRDGSEPAAEGDTQMAKATTTRKRGTAPRAPAPRTVRKARATAADASADVAAPPKKATAESLSDGLSCLSVEPRGDRYIQMTFTGGVVRLLPVNMDEAETTRVRDILLGWMQRWLPTERG